MKPLELLKLWSDLQIVLNDSRFSANDKAMVCSEVLRSLPPAMVCTHAPETRELVGQLIKKELENYRGTTTGKPTPEQTPTKEVETKVRPGKREGSAVRSVRGQKSV